MAITRTREVTVADVWADDDGGVTLEVGEGRTSLSVIEAVQFAMDVTKAAVEAQQAVSERAEAELSIEQMKARQSGADGLRGVI